MAHPDLEAEQAYIDHAYDCLEASRQAAVGLRRLIERGPGGTHQNRWDSEVVDDVIRNRLAQLHLGDVSLCFGRIDQAEGDSFHIGRIAVSDEHQEPVVVDWRAPVAEPFYRATGREPMGLARRRHFATKGRELLDIEDEHFGTGEAHDEIVGKGSLIAALEESRTGYLGDIVATIQAEQDEIIRSELGGVLVVQGGPGTGKTVVALHRAAYLLYTHRFPLEGQGVLVVGPNRVFLRYIERVLPSLGEAGVELVTLADLVSEPVADVTDAPAAGAVKGDARMAKVLTRAVRDRQRRLRDDLAVPFGATWLRLTVAESDRIVRAARRRSRTHNAGRRIVEQQLWETFSDRLRQPLAPDELRDRLRGTDEVRAALEWMWPVLSPADLLRDLFGSRALVRSAARRVLEECEQEALHRPRGESLADVVWTLSDVPLLDEARSLLGPRVRYRTGKPVDDADEIRTFGHIVVDEAQDLTPMQLRMLARRSLNGSMTVVGDVAQATGPSAPDVWDDVLAHLPDRRPARHSELTIGYRTPAQVMQLASRVLAVAAPDLTPPRSVREGDAAPRIERVEPADLARRVAEVVGQELAAVDGGRVAVVASERQAAELDVDLDAVGLAHGVASRTALDAEVTLLPVRLAKGLELDSVVVVEPARIVAEEPQGMRSLYVALTRATRRLAVVHAHDLPDALRDTAASAVSDAAPVR